MSKKTLNLETKFQKLRQKRLNSICCDYITYASEISDNQISPWRIICGLAEKYGMTTNTIYAALRSKKIYCGKSNPLCKEGVDEFLKNI